MSFMFNPHPYNDMNAVNHIKNIPLNNVCFCNDELELILREVLDRKIKFIGIDGYVTAPFDTVIDIIKSIDKNIRIISTRDLCKPVDVLDSMFSKNLPNDREKDPILLYGSLFEGDYIDLFDSDKLNFPPFDGLTVIFGNGSLCDELIGIYDYKIYIDITPKMAVLNIKNNGYINLGSTDGQPFRQTMRRCYYVDFELSFNQRDELLRDGSFDLYISGDDPDALVSMSNCILKKILDETVKYPFRCRPVYLEGVWGGHYIKNLRDLPDSMKNCAWVFDLIPMEVSIVIENNGKYLEFPYYTLIHTCREKLLGERSMEQFGCYFPIRFNYDDTFHSSGNMSIQLHPTDRFVKENNNELGRQDESYYIVATGQNACTYLGFKNNADVSGFLADIKKSEREYTEVDYKSYINAVDSIPGMQFMIPAGTIHASGRNQVILEIGSLTVGSYTYKMYDYLRKDLDGKPRPIHSHYGEQNLNRNINEDYAKANLVNGGKRTIRSGEGFEEFIVGECDQLYFSLRNETFTDKIEDNTDGYFHVLTLVDGEEVEIRSKINPDYKFRQKFLDIVVVPASIGEYEIVNMIPDTTIVIHKTLLKP